MRFYRDTNEVTRFLIDLFLLQVVGRLFVQAILLLFRFFGMPQPALWYHGHPYAGHVLSTFLLVVAAAVSIYRITRSGKRRRSMNQKPE